MAVPVGMFPIGLRSAAPRGEGGPGVGAMGSKTTGHRVGDGVGRSELVTTSKALVPSSVALVT